MYDIKISDEQKEYAKKLIDTYNFGQRGYADGDKTQQYVGVLGQTVLADYLRVNRPTGKSGFNGGIDFLINGLRVDIKTMGRTVAVKDHYVHNFIGMQKKFEVDYYIFCSYNKCNDILTICGYISKGEFNKLAKFYRKGARRYRDDGTYFLTKANLYEIKQSDLHQCSNVEEVKNNIKS